MVIENKVSRHRLPNGIVVECVNVDEVEAIYREIFVEQAYLRHGIRLWPGMTVLDGGAHIGLFTLFVAPRIYPGKIIAIEPSPSIYQLLRRNLADVENATSREVALAKGEGSVAFRCYSKVSAMSGIADYGDREGDWNVLFRSLERSLADSGLEPEPEELSFLTDSSLTESISSVRTLSLSYVIKTSGWRKVDLLKLDIQGAEFDVLSSLEDPHWDLIGQIAGEVHDRITTEGSQRDRLVRLVEERGFAVKVMQDSQLAATNRYSFTAVRK
jgi:FkbM family methyltransferase